MLKNFYKFIKEHKISLLLGIIFICIGVISWFMGLNVKIVATSILLYGLITQLFSIIITYFISLISTIPWAGPLIVRVLMLPAFLLLNTTIYLATLLKIRKGGPKLNAEAAATVLTIGILIGYILAKML